MAVLNKLFFTKKKVNLSDEHILQENVRSVYITNEQVRLLLFKECDWKGRQVVFDSSIVEKVPLDGADFSRNLSAVYKTKYGKSNTGQTNNCFVYKFKSIPADANSLGDMIFGAVAMNYGGTSLKIHVLNEPKRLMCTKVFTIPSHKTAATSRKTSKVAMNGENCSKSNSSTKPLDMPNNTGEDVSLSFSLGRGDSGYCGEHSMASSISSLYDISSDIWSRDENYHDDLYSFKTPTNGRKLSTSSNGSWHRRVMRNISTRLDVSGHNSNYLNIPSTTMSRNSSTNSDSQMAGGSTTDSLSSTTSQSSRTRLGLALVFTLTDSDTLRYCLEHCQQLESLVCRLRHAVLLGGARCESLVHITELATQWLDELINGPRLHPIWHSLVSEKRETREIIAEHFLDSICSLLDSSDTKHTNFFISTLVTTVLTYHLGWVSTVSPFEPACAPMLGPYGALWAQLGDLRGAPPAPATRTLVSGRPELVSRLLHALTYFIRCGRVTRLMRRGNVFKDCAEQMRNNNVIKTRDPVTNLKDSLFKMTNVDLDSSNSKSFPPFHDERSSTVLMNDLNDQTYDDEAENCEVHYVVNSTSKVIRTTSKYAVKSCTGRCDFEIKTTCAKSIPSVLKLNEKSGVKSCSNILSTRENNSNEKYVSSDSCTPVSRRDLHRSGTSSYLCENIVGVTKNSSCNGLKKSSTFITKLPSGISDISSEESDRDSDQTFTEPKRSRKTSVFHLPDKSLNCVNKHDGNPLNTWIPQPLVPEQLDSASSEVSYPNLKTTLKRKPTVFTALNNYSDEDSNSSMETESNMDNEDGKGVLFVLGDDEKLVGLKNKCADRKFVKRSSRSEEVDIDVTRSKDIDSKNISIVPSAATQDERSKINVIETKQKLCEIEDDTKMEVSELKCCRNQQLQHSKPIKHSGVKFEFEKFPQIVINYMKSKNLEILDSDYIGKPGNLKLDGYKFDPSSVFPDMKERCENCQQCQMAESVLQTPSNASELEFTSDMPARTFAEEKIEVPVVMPPKSFVRRKKEKTIVINTCSLNEKNCNQSNIQNDTPANYNGTPCRTEMPIYSSQESNENPVECGVGFDQTLLRGVTDHYVPDVILQGTTMSVHQFEPHMRRDLELSTYVNRIFDNADRQALAIVADTEKWTVRVWSSKGPLNGLGSMSTLVGNMLDVLPHLRNARVPTNECILYMESKLRDFCILSKTMSDILMTTDFCDMATLTKALNIDANDVPLLLAVATTHTPQVASRYGVSYR